MFYLIFATLIFVLTPSFSYAWGPAAHLEYAGHALSSLALFAPWVKRLISKYQDHFLYGSIAADITLGKDQRGYLYNCHNWQVAFNLLEDKAKEDHQKAFMLGYLSHLAADTVAHNFFVPYKMVRSWKTSLLKHVYWEMRFDLSVPEKYWQMMEIYAQNSYADDDALLEGHLKRTIFSFKTNKKIFNSLLVLQRLKHYRKFADTHALKTVWTLSEQDIKNYKTLVFGSVVDFLKNPEKSFCLKADPTGKLKILYARDLVQKIKQADKRGHLTQIHEHRLLHDIKKQFQIGIYEQGWLPSIENYL